MGAKDSLGSIIRLVLINLLEKRLRIAGTVVLDNFRGIAIVDLHNEFSEFTSNGFIELL